jgi:hypothetical protein
MWDDNRTSAGSAAQAIKLQASSRQPNHFWLGCADHMPDVAEQWMPHWYTQPFFWRLTKSCIIDSSPQALDLCDVLLQEVDAFTCSTHRLTVSPARHSTSGQPLLDEGVQFRSNKGVQ